MATPKIFFFHNAKAGGTSIARALYDTFPSSTACPCIENDAADHVLNCGYYSPFKGYDTYSGHYGLDIFNIVNDGHLCTTNFRHPVSRIVSLYNFFRNSVPLDNLLRQDERKQYPYVKLAKSLSLHDFVASDDPQIDIYIKNFHFRQLTGSPWELHTNTATMQEACQLIAAMPCFYVCEFPALSLRTFRDALGLCQLQHLNQTGHADKSLSVIDLDDETFRLIQSKNELDFALYQHAINVLLTR